MSFKSICNKLEAEREESHTHAYDTEKCAVEVTAHGTRKGTEPWRLKGFEVIIYDFKAGVSATWWLDERGNCNQDPDDSGEDTTPAMMAAWENFCNGSPLDEWIDGLVEMEGEIQEQDEE